MNLTTPNELKERKSDENKTEFLVFCIELYKTTNKKSGTDVYDLMEISGLKQYILDFYSVLQTQGEKQILEDMKTFLKVRGYE